VAVNLCVDRSRQARPSEELPALLSKEKSAEAEMLREEQKRMLSVALAALPVKERAAVVLREIECLSTADVAVILGSSEGTVRSQISKAMTRLRALLNREEK
jgi:RNA polymerase sigma-70 factor (ECF subfamily)